MKAKNLKQKLNSVSFRTWLTFILMTLIVIILLWLFQVLFYSFFYQSMKKNTAAEIGKNLVHDYQNTPSYWNSVSKIARANNVTIYFFRLKSNQTDMYSAYDINRAVPHVSEASIQKLEVLDWSNEQFSQFYSYAQEGNKKFSYLTDKENCIVHVNVINDYGDKIYLYIASYLDPVDSTTKILSTQLIIVTVICIGLSIILSYLLSKKITDPIINFSKEAEKLGDGNYNVKFKEDSYNELNVLSKTLNYAIEEMEKTETFRREFIANVSHDLRTPLTMVKAYAEMIRDISGRNEQKRTHHAQIIIDEAERLNSLVEDIQNLSKLQAGTDTKHAERFELSGLCIRVINRFGVMSEKFGYVIKKDIAPDVEVFADSRKIEQVLYNLIGNAINYTGEDKIVYLILTIKDGMAEVRIRDTGKGIAPEEIESVWDRYYRANQIKRKVVGSGLGLSIVKNILVMHEAEYGIDSELNKGTDFWFKLPLYDGKDHK